MRAHHVPVRAAASSAVRGAARRPLAVAAGAQRSRHSRTRRAGAQAQAAGAGGAGTCSLYQPFPTFFNVAHRSPKIF